MKLVLFSLIAAIGLCPWASLVADSKDSANDEKIEQFARAYKSETSPDKKRELCIKAIDEGLFTRGSSVTIIDRLFGTNFTQDFMPAGQDEDAGAVAFSPQPRQDGHNQIAPVGWYLAVKWDRTRKIQDYFLSNLYK